MENNVEDISIFLLPMDTYRQRGGVREVMKKKQSEKEGLAKSQLILMKII